MNVDKLCWTLDVEENPENGELFITFPKDALEMLNWSEGDEIEWIKLDDDTWTLKKKEK